MNKQEVRQQKFDHFKKQALLALTTAFRAPLMLMMGCGYVNFGGKRHDLNDYDGRLTVKVGVFETEPYDEVKHGEKIDFVELGERIPNQSNSTDGKSPIHRHHTKNAYGVHTFNYE